MSARASTLLNHKESMDLVMLLQKLGWVVYGLEPPDDMWFQIAPSDNLILLKQLEDAKYNDFWNVPYFLISEESNEDGLYTIVFPKGKDFNTTQELLMWADEF